MKKIFTLLSLIVLVVAGGSLMAGTYDDLAVSLNEEQANTPDHPIRVSLNNGIKISLQGEESYSNVYCSGAGSEHGYRWEYDKSNENAVLVEGLEMGTYINHGFLPGADESNNAGWVTQQTPQSWSFTANQVGTVTLTFKKYFYSDAKVFNLDGSSPWKDPVETIQFTINVVDDAAPAASSN